MTSVDFLQVYITGQQKNGRQATSQLPEQSYSSH